MTVAVKSGLIIGSVCDTCGMCPANLSHQFESFKWVHIGILVDTQTRRVIIAGTPWKGATSHVSIQAEFDIGSYDDQTSSLTISGFTVSLLGSCSRPSISYRSTESRDFILEIRPVIVSVLGLVPPISSLQTPWLLFQWGKLTLTCKVVPSRLETFHSQAGPALQAYPQ